MTIPPVPLMSRLVAAFDGRPVRWAAAQLGDYDGRDRTLEVFNADPSEQRDLVRRLRPLRAALERDAGGPVVLVFHTRAQSAGHYAAFVEEALRSQVAADVSEVHLNPRDEFPRLATDIGLCPRQDDRPGTGSTSLPRKAAA